MILSPPPNWEGSRLVIQGGVDNDRVCGNGLPHRLHFLCGGFIIIHSKVKLKVKFVSKHLFNTKNALVPPKFEPRVKHQFGAYRCATTVIIGQTMHVIALLHT